MKRRGWVVGFCTIAVVGAAALLWLGLAGRDAAPAPELTDPSLMDPAVAREIERATAFVNEHPRDAAARVKLAMTYHAHAMLEEALTCYEQALALDDDQARAWHLLAIVRAELGDAAGAVEDSQRAAALEKGVAAIHWRRGHWLAQLSRLDEAEAAFRQALRIDPNDPGGSLGLARLAVLRGNPKEAISQAQIVLAKNSKHIAARQMLGAAYRADGQFESARIELARAGTEAPRGQDPWLKEVRQLRTGYKAQLENAQELMDAGQPAAAIARLEQLRLTYPRDVPLALTLASAQRRAGQVDLAIQTLTRLLPQQGQNFVVHLNLAHAYALKEQWSLALGHVNESLRLNAQQAAGHELLADLLSRQGKHEEAMAACRGALHTGSSTLTTWLRLADSQLALQRWEEAVGTYAEAARLFPASSSPYVGVSAIQAQLGRLDPAELALRHAQRLNPADPDIPTLLERYPALKERLAQRR